MQLYYLYTVHYNVYNNLNYGNRRNQSQTLNNKRFSTLRHHNHKKQTNQLPIPQR